MAKAEFPDIKDISIEQIWDYHDRGLDSKKMPEEIVQYLDAMDKVRAMSRRFDKYGGKGTIINYLVDVVGYSRYLANQLYNNSFEYFNTNDSISKDSLLNWIIEMMQNNIQEAILKAHDVADNARISRMLKELKEVLMAKGSEDDKWAELAERKPLKIYSLKPEDIGLAHVGEKEIAALVAKIPGITEAQRKIIEGEAALLPIDIFQPQELRNE
ncbi:hypothetical protein [Altibacter sp. HG106]|uniref:hypothetical protein n=1 Tax=Altibacter sp. HG106 TaxID=3023937 RepID=UPI002350279B|nr:hypothetical protein [Altibacter sp. HG106]MDC7994460.1 hypothetical protein [Altibacter sp. HG106]